MIRILQIIFGLDPIAGQLRVARQRLVLFKELRRITALTVILAVAGIAGHSLRALSTAATTTAALTIVNQLVVSLSHWRRFHRSPLVFPSTEVLPLTPADRPAPKRSASRPSLAVNRLLGGSAAISSGVGGGGASFFVERPRPWTPM